MSSIKLFRLSADQVTELQGSALDHECQQRLGVPDSGPARRGAHARQGRRREGSRASVLCGGDTGNAVVGDWGGWG